MGYKVLYGPKPDRIPAPNLPMPKMSRLLTTTVMLDNLRKFSNYSIQVLAFTSAGDGVYSDVVMCATHEDGKTD